MDEKIKYIMESNEIRNIKNKKRFRRKNKYD